LVAISDGGKMNFNEVMTTLENAGTAQNRKVYTRHGAHPPMFGVSFAILRNLAKKNMNDQKLAVELWETGNYDACLLACQVADPAQLDDSLAEAWVRKINNYVISGEFSQLVAKSPLARKKAEKWVKSPEEYVSRTGWLILSWLADHSDLSDGYFEPYLSTIENDIHKSPNRTRDAMNTALINIGLRPGLTKQCLSISKRIGKVNVDHGETGCKTPDAGEYIKRTLDYRAKKKSKSKK
jgi:3-methyladenine DNA glycosylase AlkD